MEEIALAGSVVSESVDFSMLSLFLRADFVVKSVIIILITKIQNQKYFVQQYQNGRKVNLPLKKILQLI